MTTWLAAGDVDEPGVALHELELAGGDDALGLRRQGERQHHEVGAGERVGEAVGLEHVVDAVEVAALAAHDGDVAVRTAAAAARSDSVMPPPPRIVTRPPSRFAPCGAAHDVPGRTCRGRAVPARASASASSATGSAYTPLPHVHTRSWSSRWTKFSMPAHGSWTQRAWCLVERLGERGRDRGVGPDDASASASGTTWPPPSFIASAIQAGRGRGRGRCGGVGSRHGRIEAIQAGPAAVPEQRAGD